MTSEHITQFIQCTESSNHYMGIFFGGGRKRKRCRFPFTFVRNPIDRFILGIQLCIDAVLTSMISFLI